MKQSAHLTKGELRFHGKNSCYAIAQQRPKDIIKIYFDKILVDEYSDLITYAKEIRKNINFVDNKDLERLTDTTHHQGICMVAKEKPILQEPDLIKELRNIRQQILYLDGVGNPHNLGAILRTASHFGVSYVCVPQKALPRISPSAHRTSEGAAEFVSVVHVKDPDFFFSALKKRDFKIYGLDIIDSAIPLYGTRLSEKSVFVLGAEVAGISTPIQELLDASIKVPGTGVIESLNVSVAAALAMGEFSRQGLEKNVRIVKKPL